MDFKLPGFLKPTTYRFGTFRGFRLINDLQLWYFKSELKIDQVDEISFPGRWSHISRERGDLLFLIPIT